ncbi:MAG TPA: response regulator [Thermoclostridium caenicola]|nr:response regulator [Thermoclostridium caenicola]
MLRILVVDDENIVLDSIRYIVEKHFDQVEVETARSGREAIEKAETVKPDLIFMDIRMPGINGIDAIREIKAVYPQVQIVILSACEQFEFAKEAVNLGVVEYLLKPVNRMKIVEIIQQAEQRIAEAREKKKLELEMKEKFEKVLPVLEHGFIYSILLYEDYNQELENYRRLLDLPDGPGYVMTLEFGEERQSGRLGNVIGSNVLSQSFYPQLRDIIKSRLNCVVGPVMLNRIICYVPVPEQHDDYEERLEAVEAGHYIIEKITRKVAASFRMGIGSIQRSENILTSYTESMRAIKHAKESEIVHIRDIPEEASSSQTFFNIREKQLLEKAVMGETAECLTLFSQIFDELAANTQYTIEDIRGRLLELVVLLHRQALEYDIEDRDVLRGRSYLKEFLSLDEPMILKNWCKELIETITAGIRAVRAKRCHHLISLAKNYIDANYHRDLSLEEVSREIGLSPQYFSRFFKEETGENFIDYLTRIRITEAKRLLRDQKLSVKEVCYQVGYNDPNYFSKLFKKATGFSPSEFRE